MEQQSHKYSLEFLLSSMEEKFDPEIRTKLLNLYLTGSRVYGTATEESDWDFLAITSAPTTNLLKKDEQEYERNLPLQPTMNLNVYEEGEVNVSCYTKEHFELLLQEHRIGMLDILYLPQQYVFQQKAQFDFKIDPDVLKCSATWEASNKFSAAKRRFLEGKHYKAKKLILLSFRYLLFTQQLLEENKIDFTAANKYWDELRDDPSTDWEHYNARYYPILHQLDTQVRSMRLFFDFYSKDELEMNSLIPLKRHPRVEYSELSHVSKEDDHPIIKYITKTGLKEMSRELSISVCRHTQHKHIVQLSPNAFTPFAEHAIARDCCPLILDCKDGFKVLGMGFKKFFDYKDEEAAEDLKTILNTSWNKVTVYDKLDGHLCILYPYNGQWLLASSKNPDANEPLNYKDMPRRTFFNKKFWELWNSLHYQLPKDMNRCYMFEMCTNYCRRIVGYPKDRLVLIGVRELSTLRELDPVAIAQEYQWDAIQTFQFSSLEDVLRSAKNLNPFQCKGFVLCDDQFNRISVFSPKYIAASASTGYLNKGFGPFNLGAENMDEDCLMDLVRSNRLKRFLHYFPRWTDISKPIEAKYNKMCEEMDKLFEETKKNSANEKDFADKVKNDKYAVVLFALQREVTCKTAKQYLAQHERKKCWKYYAQYS